MRRAPTTAPPRGLLAHQGSPRGTRWTDGLAIPRAGRVPGACRRLSVVPVAGGAALAGTRAA